MCTTQALRGYFHKEKRGYCLLLLYVLFSLLALLVLGPMATAYADSMPGGNVADPVVRAVDIAEPAVVRIFTIATGHLAVQFSTGTVNFPQQGNGYQFEFSGSGTFITSHGDILTADHVINLPAQDPGIAQAFEDTAAPDVTQYMNQHHLLGGSLTQDQVDQELHSGQLPSTPHFDSTSSIAFLSTSYSGPLTATNLQNLPAGLSAPVDTIEKESAFNQADVAIVHVPLEDTPSVPLGDSSNVQQQDELTIIGFPGNGDVSQRPTDMLTSSVNKIFVSSIKTTDSGAQVIQVGGNIEHGDSGGPALDSHGDVVGIVSFGLSSSGSIGGTSFLQASNSARTLIQSLKLDTTPGPFEKAWTQAFNDYAATTPGHWHKAAREFQQLATSYPLFKAVVPYLNYAQAQAAQEQLPPTPTPASQSHSAPAFNLAALIAPTLLVGTLLVLVLLTVVLVRIAWRRGRRDKQPAYIQTVQKAQPVVPTSLHGQLPPSPTSGMQAPPFSPTADSLLDGMSAFGAPVKPKQAGQPQQPVYGQVPATQATPLPVPAAPGSSPSSILRVWPCGHMNRPGARFCSVCGEPAPPPTQRMGQ
jgi:S1-C subfamily serine protease